MGKHIAQMNDLSGSEQFYEYNKELVEISNTFIYEISLHKYWKNGYCLLGCKFFKSDKLLPIKNNSIYKKYNGYLIEKEITLIKVPKDFINELEIYKPKIKKNDKRNRKVRQNC